MERHTNRSGARHIHLQGRTVQDGRPLRQIGFVNLPIDNRFHRESMRRGLTTTLSRPGIAAGATDIPMVEMIAAVRDAGAAAVSAGATGLRPHPTTSANSGMITKVRTFMSETPLR
jgi:hypothetical protein